MIRKSGGIKVGDLVRLKGRLFRTGYARIELFYEDINGGCRLDKPLAGFYSWNVADLRLVHGVAEQNRETGQR